MEMEVTSDVIPWDVQTFTVINFSYLLRVLRNPVSLFIINMNNEFDTSDNHRKKHNNTIQY